MPHLTAWLPTHFLLSSLANSQPGHWATLQAGKALGSAARAGTLLAFEARLCQPPALHCAFCNAWVTISDGLELVSILSDSNNSGVEYNCYGFVFLKFIGPSLAYLILNTLVCDLIW